MTRLDRLAPVRRLPWLVTAFAVVAILGIGPGRALGQTATSTPTVTVTPTATATPILVRVAIEPADQSIGLGEVQRYTATGHFDNASTANITQLVEWASSVPTVAVAMNASGDRSRIDPVGIGVTTISATHLPTGVTSTSTGDDETLTVVGPLECIVLTPVTVERAIGQSQFFTAIGHFQGGGTENLTQLVTYASSDTGVALAPNDDGQRSRVDAIGSGVSTISATDTDTGVSSDDASCNGSATLTVPVPATPTVTVTPTVTSTAPTVTPTPTLTATPTVTPTPTATPTPTLVSLDITPKTRQVTVGDVARYTVIGTFSDGSTQNLTQNVTYISSLPTVATAPNEQDDRSRIESASIGVTTISVTHVAAGVSSSGAENSVLTVVGPLECIVLSPATDERDVGESFFYTAIGHFQGGGTQNLTPNVDYTSSNEAVALALNTAGQKSRVDPVGPGTTTISATDPGTGVSSDDAGCNGNATLTVPLPATPTVTATPTATSTAPTATPTVTATPTPTPTPMLVNLDITPKTRQVTVGDVARYTVTGTFSDGSTQNLTQNVTYISSLPTVATAPNEQDDRSRIESASIGITTISVTHVATGVTSSGGENSTLTVVGPLAVHRARPDRPRPQRR